MSQPDSQDSNIKIDSFLPQNEKRTFSIKTRGGLSASITKTVIDPQSALDSIYDNINTKKGAILSSGFDYPGRHSRWDIGFVNPALEFVSQKASFYLNSLNEQGRALLAVISEPLSQCSHICNLQIDQESIKGKITAAKKHIKEEERSKQPSIFSVIRQISDFFHSDHPAFCHFGLYGAFGYDLIHQFEHIKLKLERSADSRDCHLFLPLSLTAVDRKKELAFETSCSYLTTSGETASLEGGGKPYELKTNNEDSTITCDHTKGEFAKKVKKVIEGTTRGDYFEVVLSQTFSTSVNASPTTLFRRLAKINPSPYMFLLNFGDEQLIGASPEIYARVKGKTYETCPIAGTVQRGKSALEDADRVMQLIGSFKDESELTMCTDVDRNDMARVCIPGTVKIIGRRQLEFYSHLIHTVDHIQGTLDDKFDSIDAFQSHMWACTVTGAPKPAAVQEIENLEASPRGWYSGAIGVIAFNGDLNTGITLRTATVKDGVASIRAGATLLFGSNPDLEEEETKTKAAAFLAALSKTSESSKDSPPSTNKSQKVSGAAKRRILLVDFQDSFVHNLAAYLREIGAKVSTLRSGFPVEMLDEIKPNLVLLSPGPCTPKDFNMSSLIDHLIKHQYPIFGVCLGHQGIGEYFGATLSKLPHPVHGKACFVSHNDDALFKDISNPFEVGRYHSLYLEESSIPSELKILAKSVENKKLLESSPIVMSIRHSSLPIAGVQFHPESLMTLKNNVGHKMLKNIIKELT